MNIREIGFAAVAVLSVASGSAGAATLSAGGIGIAEPDSVVNGRSIGSMAAEWWRFLYENPVSGSPFFGAPYVPGPLAGEGTFFLYGLAPGGETVGTLKAWVRPGSALLLPMRPWSNLKTLPDETAEILLEQLDPFVGTIRNLSVSVNGEDVASANGVDLIADFRERFPSDPEDEAFAVTFPDTDSVYSPDYDGYTFEIMVADGHWMLFDDLPRGNHTIVASYDVVDNDGNTVESVAVTHLISAVPLPAPLALMGAAMLALGAVGRARRKKTAAEAVL